MKGKVQDRHKTAPPLPGVTLVIPSLCPGGAEKVMTDMANYWAQQSRPVCLVTFDSQPASFPLHPGVRRLALNDMADAPDAAQQSQTPPRGTGATLHLWPHEAANVQHLRQVLELAGHEAVLSFLPRMNMRVLLAAQGGPWRVVVAERTHPPMMPLGDMDEALRRCLYPLAHRVVCLTRCTRDTWGKSFVPPHKLRVIPNAFVPPNKSSAATDLGTEPGLDVKAGAESNFVAPRPYVVAAGRLSAEKGFDRLLVAWRTVHEAHPALRLVIAGEGPERDALHALTCQLGLENHVLFPGFVSPLTPLLRAAHFFVLPSHFEGFPNALLEALGVGTPAVAFDCPTGPGEILRHEHNGLLVPPDNVPALAAALLRLAGDEALRQGMCKAAREVRARFRRGRIMTLWERALWGQTCGLRAQPATLESVPCERPSSHSARTPKENI